MQGFWDKKERGRTYSERRASVARVMSAPHSPPAAVSKTVPMPQTVKSKRGVPPPKVAPKSAPVGESDHDDSSTAIGLGEDAQSAHRETSIEGDQSEQSQGQHAQTAIEHARVEYNSAKHDVDEARSFGVVLRKQHAAEEEAEHSLRKGARADELATLTKLHSQNALRRRREFVQWRDALQESVGRRDRAISHLKELGEASPEGSDTDEAEMGEPPVQHAVTRENRSVASHEGNRSQQSRLSSKAPLKANEPPATVSGRTKDPREKHAKKVEADSVKRDESTGQPKVKDPDLRYAIQQRRQIVRDPEGFLIFSPQILALLDRDLNLLQSDVVCFQERVEYLKSNPLLKADVREILDRHSASPIAPGTRLCDVGFSELRTKGIILAEIAAIAEDLELRTLVMVDDEQDISARVHLFSLEKDALLRHRNLADIGPSSTVTDGLEIKYRHENMGRKPTERNPLRRRRTKKKRSRSRSPSRRRRSRTPSTSSSSSGVRSRKRRSRSRERRQRSRDREADRRDSKRYVDLKALKSPNLSCTSCEGVGHRTSDCGKSAKGVKWSKVLPGKICRKCGGRKHGETVCPSASK